MACSNVHEDTSEHPKAPKQGGVGEGEGHFFPVCCVPPCHCTTAPLRHRPVRHLRLCPKQLHAVRFCTKRGVSFGCRAATPMRHEGGGGGGRGEAFRKPAPRITYATDTGVYMMRKFKSRVFWLGHGHAWKLSRGWGSCTPS